MEKRKVSVILPTYNRAYIIKNSIRSILDQTYKDYELIIKAYKAIDEGKAVSKDEKKNEEAANRMNRHAIENCEILTSDNPSGGGV